MMTAAMKRPERTASGFQLAPGSKVGIIAGGGSLPVEVAEGLVKHGFAPFIIIATGEVDREADFAAYDQEKLALEDIGLLFPLLKRRGITHLVLAGEIKRRPRLSRIRPTLGLLAIIPSVVRALRRGDDGLLKMLTRALETRGVKVVGAHEVVPELTAGEGALTATEPNQSDWRDIEAAHAAGLAGIAVEAGRSLILEGPETLARANALGLFIVGLPPMQSVNGEPANGR
jgi:DUF1009 family protein